MIEKNPNVTVITDNINGLSLLLKDDCQTELNKMQVHSVYWKFI